MGHVELRLKNGKTVVAEEFGRAFLEAIRVSRRSPVFTCGITIRNTQRIIRVDGCWMAQGISFSEVDDEGYHTGLHQLFVIAYPASIRDQIKSWLNALYLEVSYLDSEIQCLDSERTSVDHQEILACRSRIEEWLHRLSATRGVDLFSCPSV